jgi:N-acetylglucosaminyl-diphospho-decaprenol L-rhamnosyltransferase
MEPIVTLVVVNYNCKRWLERFFQSVKEQTIFDRCEVLMVDNTSKDGSAEICEQVMKSWTNGRFVPTGGNFGYGAACNIGAAQARGKYLFFLNPDVWLERNCLEALVSHAETSTAKVFSGIELGYDDDQFVRGSQGQGLPGFDLFGCMTTSSAKQNLDELLAIGSFQFIQREFFLKIGGFDREYFVYGEEMDLSWRVRIAGEPIELVRPARVHHAAAGCSEPTGRTSEFRRFYANRNQILTILKNANGPLLVLAFNLVLLITVEAVAGALLSRSFSFIQMSLFKPLAACWRLRHYIGEQRRLIRSYRQRGDWWIARRYFRFEFGHWGDIKRFMKWKIVIDKSPLPAKTSQSSTGN